MAPRQTGSEPAVEPTGERESGAGHVPPKPRSPMYISLSRPDALQELV